MRHRSAPAAVVLVAALAFVFGCRTTAPPAPVSPPPVVAPAPAPIPAAPAAEAGAIPWRHDWAHGTVFYEVFVRSFADSDGDGVGDLAGLTAKLDYLNDGKPGGDDLGVEALWLMPIFESPSYHGYDTVDYERIDREYGSEEDFDRFLAEAHRRGIRVILDLVMNHTSAQHPWFVESRSGADSARRDWYVWRADDPGWTQPWGGSNATWHRAGDAYYYGVFWGGMPDLNYANPEVRAEMKRVAELWLRRGVDGFRLDATRHLFANGPDELQNDQPETHAFLRELSAYVRSVEPEAMLVGENWTSIVNIAPYFGEPSPALPGGDELPFNFDFPLAASIVDGVAAGDATAIVATLTEVALLYPEGAGDATFLTNHDQVRVATRLAGDDASLRLAAAILLTLPGTPFLYYGEEIGLPNAAASHDEAKRTPLPWSNTLPGRGFTTASAPWYDFAPAPPEVAVEVQRRDPDSLLAHYRKLVALRQETPALRQGTTEVLSPAAGEGGSVLTLVRTSGDERVLVVHNLGDAEATGAWNGMARGAARLFGAGDAAVADGAVRFTVPPRSSTVWKLD